MAIGIKDVVDFVPAKTWRGMGLDDMLKSIEIGTRCVKGELEDEASDARTEISLTLRLLDISMAFQELAFGRLKDLDGAKL